MRSVATIRTEVEARLGARVSAAFAGHRCGPLATTSTGIDEIDRELGGVPVGAITELVAPRFVSAGRKSLQAKLLARGTAERVCALVDATDSFDPKSAQAMGVDLRRLLWIRCSGREMKGMEQAFKCADLLLQSSGGFGIILIDLAGLPPRVVRKIPLTTWFRFRAVVEKQDTALIFATSYPVTSTCSELVLTLSTQDVRWSETSERCPPHARVFAGFEFRAEITRNRACKKPMQAARYSSFTYPRWG